VNGVPVDVQGAQRTQLGYLAQDPRFYPWMTGRQTLRFVMSFFNVRRPGPRADELLELVGLATDGDRPTGQYSGGMRQRLGIAQALAGDPSVLLLDEPAASLDPLGRHDVLELLKRLKGATTVFYSTHILDDVERVSDHVAILDGGRLVVSAPTRELVRHAGRQRIRVALVGATADTGDALARLAGVARVIAGDRVGPESRYELVIGDAGVEQVQGAVMRFAADHGLVIVANHPEVLDLESVFLRIVNQERAA
jgi:ABC-2 type transport system ATP-binding protein